MKENVGGIAEAGRKRGSHESDVHLKKKDCNILLGGLRQTQGTLHTGETTGMGRRHRAGSVLGVGMQKCDCCLIYYPDLKNINLKPDRPEQRVWEKLCINY